MSSTATDKKSEGVQAGGIRQAFDFLDLKAQFATIREEVLTAVTRVMESQQFILGAEVSSFEAGVRPTG